MDSRSNSASATSLPQFHPVPLKLDRSNYAFWRAQVLSTIRAHGYDEFIALTAMPPSPFLPSQSGAQPRPNPEYSTWIRRDQFLLSWMLASIGESMLGHVVRCSSAREVWAILERLSFSQSKARTMQLRMALQTTRKGMLSIEEYFLKMRGFADQLSAIGQVVTDEDLMMYILAGFGPEYEALVVNFMQRSDSPSLQDMQLAFQSYELRLAQQISSFSVSDPSVNVAYYGGGRGALGRGFRGGFSKAVAASKSVICQLCGKAGHVALRCFKRFDVHFTGVDSTSATSATASSTTSGNPQAFVVECPGVDQAGDASTWFVDSGATNHVTNELENLTMCAAYTGSDGVMIGDGQTITQGSTEGTAC